MGSRVTINTRLNNTLGILNTTYGIYMNIFSFTENHLSQISDIVSIMPLAFISNLISAVVNKNFVHTIMPTISTHIAMEQMIYRLKPWQK